MIKKVVITGLLLLLIAIVLGAFGAHGLKKIISIDKINSFEVGVRYQMYIGFLILIIGLNNSALKANTTQIVRLLAIGIFLFSGSIYLLALQAIIPISLSFLGPITPIGGLLLIVAIARLIWKIIRHNQHEK